MRLAHLADLHLGFRQYHRQTPGGINQREADVANAFRSAVDGILALRPDAVIIAGDLFHAVRPTNAAIVFAFRELQRIREAMPDAPIVLIAGNHDTPRSSETGSILKLYQELGVDVALDEARRLSYPRLDLSVLAVPHASLMAPPAERPVLRPSGSERHQVLVLHGEVEGLFPHDSASLEYGGALLDLGELRRGNWSYVALGHYHVTREVAPRIWYAGALEYVSSNPWGEWRELRGHAAESGLDDPVRGWLLVDFDRGTVERRPVSAGRTIADLKRLDARDMTPHDLDEALVERLATVPGGLDDAVVRLVVENAPRHVVRELDHAALRMAKARALHLHLDFRRPESTRETGAGGPGTRRQSLPELVRDYLSGRPLPERVDRDRFVGLGLELLQEPEEAPPGEAA